MPKTSLNDAMPVMANFFGLADLRYRHYRTLQTMVIVSRIALPLIGLVARRSGAATRHLMPRLRLTRSRLDQPRPQNAIHPAGDRARLRCWLGATAARSRGLVKVVRTFSLIEYRNLSLCRYRRPGGHLSSY